MIMQKISLGIVVEYIIPNTLMHTKTLMPILMKTRGSNTRDLAKINMWCLILKVSTAN